MPPWLRLWVKDSKQISAIIKVKSSALLDLNNDYIKSIMTAVMINDHRFWGAFVDTAKATSS